MACWTVKTTEETKRRQEEAVKRLERALASNAARVVVDKRTGAIAFAGPAAEALAKDGLADTCVYRRLLVAGSFALRTAVMKAEALAGRKVSEQAIAAGQHSHDGGSTWSKH